MKNITQKLIQSLRSGYCTPQIARIAKRLNEPATTIHYNVKKLENTGAIRAYKAVFDHSKIGQGFCAFVHITLSPEEYGNPERVGKELAKHPEVESVDVVTGNCELILKIRAKDQKDYYTFVKNVISRKGIARIKTNISLNQIKTEYTFYE